MTLYWIQIFENGSHESIFWDTEPAHEKKGVMSRSQFWDMATWSRAVDL